MSDLQNEEALKQTSIRSQGGGRKALIKSMDGIDKAFLDTLKNHTAGDPMDDKVKWTALSKADISKALKKKGFL